MSADPAMARFFILQALRWCGVAMVLVGLLVANRKLQLPELAGHVLIVVGLFGALIAPILLARRWKSPSR